MYSSLLSVGHGSTRCKRRGAAFSTIRLAYIPLLTPISTPTPPLGTSLSTASRFRLVSRQSFECNFSGAGRGDVAAMPGTGVLVAIALALTGTADAGTGSGATRTTAAVARL